MFFAKLKNFVTAVIHSRYPAAVILAVTLQFSAYAQSENVTINAENRPVSWILSQISEQTGYEAVFSDSFLDSSRKVTMSFTDVSLETVLKHLCAEWNATYKIVNKTIVFSRNSEPERGGVADRLVSGTVIDEESVPVVGAVVMIQGTNTATTTDLDGKFSLMCPSGNIVLFASCLGYKDQSVRIWNSDNIRIVMEPDMEVLEEAIAIGYGTMKKSDLTGAVSSIKVDDGNVSSVTSVTNILAGKAAGLEVSMGSANPGAGATFRIRGAASVNSSNDPLIIIDGFPISPSSDSDIAVGDYDTGSSDNVFGSINPNDIESIEVLKDASSTAIYGARAANGVIIVTTKRGSSGAPKVTYSGSGGVSVMARRYEMMDATQLMNEANSYAYERWMLDNGVGIYGGKAPEDVIKPYIPYYTDDQIAANQYDTDWFDEISRVGYQTQHNLSITGGSDYTKYLVSGSYFRQNGIIKENDVTRATLRINLDQKITSWMNLGVNLSLSRNTLNAIPLGGMDGIIGNSTSYTPLLPVKDENGDYSINPKNSMIPNPASLLEITNITKKNRALGTAFLEIRPVEGLTLRGSIGLDANFQKHQVYVPTSTLEGALVDGHADQRSYEKNDYLVDFTATYSKDWGKHSFTAMAGYSWQQFNAESFSASNEEFPVDSFLFNNLGAGNAVRPDVSSWANMYEMASFFGRVNWSYGDRYLVTATFRADGSGRFAKNNKWGYFPSVAAGWRFSEEPFFAPLKSWWSNGKLRLSFGQTGNSAINAQQMNVYRNVNGDDGKEYNTQFGTSNHQGFVLYEIANPNLKWETTTEWNVGLDLGFFDNRLNISAEYFDKVISDLLQWRDLMRISEVRSIADNIGKTQSRGFELTINSVNISTKDFSWTSDLTFSFYRDRWLERADSWTPRAFDQYDGWLRRWDTYLSDGLIQPGEEVPWMPGAVAGQVKLKDINGYVRNPDGTYVVDEHGIPVLSGEPDGVLNEADKVIIGNNDPGYLAGFNNTFRYRNFDLNIYFYGQFGLLNYGSYQQIWTVDVSGLSTDRNYPVSISNKYSHDNPDGTYPGYFQNQSQWGIGDYFTTKTWFIRCRNITLGYTIPKQKRLTNMRVYVDVNNPFIITPYEGIDLETDSLDDGYSYPNIRTFSVGLSITF